MSGCEDLLKALNTLSKNVSEKEAAVDKNLETTRAQVKKDSERIDLFIGLIKEMGFYDKSSPNPYEGKSVTEILSGMTGEFPDPGEDEEEILKKQRKEEKKRIKLEKKKKEEQERLEREEYELKQREEQERIHQEQMELEKRQREEQERIQREKRALEAQRLAMKTEERATKLTNTASKDMCLVCKKPVTDDLIHVSGSCCHKQCFRCAKCSKPLIKYHLEQGQLPICQECFEADASNKCAACGKTIGASGHIKVGDKKYHPDCFCCAYCGNRLPQRHFNLNGKLYCSSGCANRATGNLCHKCHEPLSGSMITVLDKNYHKECFMCMRCSTQFTGLKFFPVNGEPYCESCARHLLARK